MEEAQESYEKALKIRPHYPQVTLLLAALTGQETHSAPRAYVENLFDAFASNFDGSLVDNLEYRTPALISKLLVDKSNRGSLGSVLDLGCGTGLAGLEIKSHCSYLEGIDLSNSMLEKAKGKNIYDRLTHSDILDYLSTQDLHFDCFIASDVFVYVGDLSDVFRLIKFRNSSRGKLVFTTEHEEKDGFHLQKSGRFSHSKAYIDSLCIKFNYTLSHFEIGNLRKENNLFITGGIYLLEF